MQKLKLNLKDKLHKICKPQKLKFNPQKTSKRLVFLFASYEICNFYTIFDYIFDDFCRFFWKTKICGGLVYFFILQIKEKVSLLTTPVLQVILKP